MSTIHHKDLFIRILVCVEGNRRTPIYGRHGTVTRLELPMFPGCIAIPLAGDATVLPTTNQNNKIMKRKHPGSGKQVKLWLGSLTCAALCFTAVNRANAQTQPANSLSIVSYGASTSSSDNT